VEDLIMITWNFSQNKMAMAVPPLPPHFIATDVSILPSNLVLIPLLKLANATIKILLVQITTVITP
jgi:hypothetical protein